MPMAARMLAKATPKAMAPAQLGLAPGWRDTAMVIQPSRAPMPTHTKKNAMTHSTARRLLAAICSYIGLLPMYVAARLYDDAVTGAALLVLRLPPRALPLPPSEASRKARVR